MPAKIILIQEQAAVSAAPNARLPVVRVGNAERTGASVLTVMAIRALATTIAGAAVAGTSPGCHGEGMWRSQGRRQRNGEGMEAITTEMVAVARRVARVIVDGIRKNSAEIDIGPRHNSEQRELGREIGLYDRR